MGQSLPCRPSHSLGSRTIANRQNCETRHEMVRNRLTICTRGIPWASLTFCTRAILGTARLLEHSRSFFFWSRHAPDARYHTVPKCLYQAFPSRNIPEGRKFTWYVLSAPSRNIPEGSNITWYVLSYHVPRQNMYR